MKKLFLLLLLVIASSLSNLCLSQNVNNMTHWYSFDKESMNDTGFQNLAKKDSLSLYTSWHNDPLRKPDLCQDRNGKEDAAIYLDGKKEIKLPKNRLKGSSVFTITVLLRSTKEHICEFPIMNGYCSTFSYSSYLVSPIKFGSIITPPYIKNQLDSTEYINSCPNLEWILLSITYKDGWAETFFTNQNGTTSVAKNYYKNFFKNNCDLEWGLGFRNTYNLLDLKGFIGVIDEFRAYNKILTKEELSNLFNNIPESSTPIAIKSKSRGDEIAENNSPEIVIINPKITRDLNVVAHKTKKLTVSGEINDESEIKTFTINGTEVPLDNKIFEKDLSLKLGVNNIDFTAEDIYGNKSIKSIIVNINFDEEFAAREPIAKITAENPSIDEVGTYHALFISVQNYDDESISQLDHPEKDANDLKEILLELYSFEEENIHVLSDPEREEIIEKMGELKSSVDSNDNLLIFYAGHGFWDKEEESGYWLPADAEREIKANWIPSSEMLRLIKVIKSKHTLLIADACFSGGMFKERALSLSEEGMRNLYKLNSRKAMTSGNMSTVPDKSAFMEYLLKNLKNNEDKFMTEETLFNRIKTPVVNNSNTQPQFGVLHGTGDEGGNFIFIKR
jgi:hypothetical protein